MPAQLVRTAASVTTHSTTHNVSTHSPAPTHNSGEHSGGRGRAAPVGILTHRLNNADQHRRYRQRNPQRVAEAQAAYRARNRDAYNARNRERMRAYRAAQRIISQRGE